MILVLNSSEMLSQILYHLFINHDWFFNKKAGNNITNIPSEIGVEVFQWNENIQNIFDTTYDFSPDFGWYGQHCTGDD